MRPTTLSSSSSRRSSQIVRMAPEEEKMTRRSPLDFPIVTLITRLVTRHGLFSSPSSGSLPFLSAMQNGSFPSSMQLVPYLSTGRTTPKEEMIERRGQGYSMRFDAQFVNHWPLFSPSRSCRYNSFMDIAAACRGEPSLSLYLEWERPKPGRRPDIFPQFSPMKTPLPPPMPGDPPEEEDEEEEEKKEEDPEKKEEEEEEPEKEEPEKPEA
ncbi:putative pre-mRNA-processing protein 40C-like isoform X1 [Capsicum annuum]|nr:putative pre-mRNA-processing protein 40C-like isoform X1 [Capsicum annuum]